MGQTEIIEILVKKIMTLIKWPSLFFYSLHDHIRALSITFNAYMQKLLLELNVLIFKFQEKM